MATDPDADAGPANAHGALTVHCPKGHINAWNYKFCGQCGSPIGLVPWPSDEFELPHTEASRSRVPFLVGAVALLVIAVVVSAVAVLVTRQSDDATGAPRSSRDTPAAAPPSSVNSTTCPDDPLLEAESIDLTSDGLVVSAAFISSCGGADTESNSALEVAVAEGRRDIAAGSFDFASEPLAIEPGVPARRTLIFPPGMYWRTPDMLSGSPALTAKRNGSSDRSSSREGAGPSTMVATASAAPAYGSIEEVAEAVLEELRGADFLAMRGSMSNRWVPQVSSKRVGLVADGKTWTNADILGDHLALRQRFGGARLVRSGQWTTFSDPDFWVTVVGPPRLTAEDANRWCDSNGFGVDDCFAQFVSALVGVEGTTVYRR